MTLASYFSNPSQNGSHLNYVVEKVKTCYLIDLALSAGAYWIMNQIGETHGLKLDSNVFRAKVLIGARTAVMTVYRFYVQEIK